MSFQAVGRLSEADEPKVNAVINLMC